MWNPGISISCGMSGCIFFVAFWSIFLPNLV